MTTTFTLTAAQAQAFTVTPVGETFWLVRASTHQHVGMQQPCRDAACRWLLPPVVFVQACALCVTCGGRPFGEFDWTECPDCRIELVVPSDWCEACQQVPVRRCVLNKHSIMVGGAVVATRTLGYAYAEGQPLPICHLTQPRTPPNLVVTPNGVTHNPAHAPYNAPDLTAAFAHYGPPETLVGQWAIALRKVQP